MQLKHPLCDIHSNHDTTPSALGTLMPSARRFHFLLKLTSYFNFEVGGVHTISLIALADIIRNPVAAS
jgi:hypothetical protein